MMFRTHRIFVILLCLVIFLNPMNLFGYFGFDGDIFTFSFLWFMIIAILASMIPDIDNPSSKIGKKIKIVGVMFKHRGFFHSLPALILFTYLVHFFSSTAATFAFFTGYFSHLLLDNLNYQGIYWFYPLTWRVKGFTNSNSIFEKILFYMCVLVSLVVVLKFV